MNWRVSHACDVESVAVDDAAVYHLVRLQDGALSQVTIGLCLLWHALVSQLDLLNEAGVCALQIAKAKQQGPYRATVQWKGRCPIISLSPVELEAWLHFFLRTVRDGVADVNHLDLDVGPADENGREESFVIEFPSARSPVSPEEVRRRLGLK